MSLGNSDTTEPKIKGHIVTLSSFCNRYIVIREYEPERVGPLFMTREDAEIWVRSAENG